MSAEPTHPDQLDEMERQVHEQIRFHREQFEKAVRPLHAQLMRIIDLRGPPPIHVSANVIASLLNPAEKQS